MRQADRRGSGADAQSRQHLLCKLCDLRAVVGARRLASLASTSSLELRPGAHTGPRCPASSAKCAFTYDIWGDAVNVASLMEANGTPSRVATSPKHPSPGEELFVTEARGAIQAKNTGELAMFLCPIRRECETTVPPRTWSRSTKFSTCRITLTMVGRAALLAFDSEWFFARGTQRAAFFSWPLLCAWRCKPHSTIEQGERNMHFTKFATACSALLITSAALAQTAPPLGTPVGEWVGTVTLGGLLGFPVGTAAAHRRRRPAGRHCDRPGDRHLDRAPQEGPLAIPARALVPPLPARPPIARARR